MAVLLAAALPLQGLLAATMACPSVAGGAIPMIHAGWQPHHGMQAGTDHEHSHQAATKAEDAGNKCSVCAACCLGTALPTRAPSFEPTACVDRFAAIRPAPAILFLTSGLDRPPRTRPS